MDNFKLKIPRITTWNIAESGVKHQKSYQITYAWRRLSLVLINNFMIQNSRNNSSYSRNFQLKIVHYAYQLKTQTITGH
jgi:hypothetical protein